MEQFTTTNNTAIANSPSEQKAKLALNYNPFHSLNLENIKNKVKSILEHIGRNGIFDEYTKHNISHIDKMLDSLEWIIPEKTKGKLSHAEWLMIVLSIYFHDLGMLVTRDEFDKRYETDFTIYKQKVLDGIYGIEYKSKVEQLEPLAMERFLYQEFVRIHHAQRIKAWILNKNFENIGTATTVVNEIAMMLNELDSAFRRDLALICESHHLDDLNDTVKYKLNAAYGSSKEEIVDLQYVAVILRTADLLHITSDRTPSIEFRLINPSDPVSQNEWYKQMAVKQVRAQLKFNKDGEVDKNLVSDTIEVVAYFDDPSKANSFFALISYLNYAKKQIKKSFDWIQYSNKKFATEKNFPWRDIDDSLIETEGFERRLFEFVLDQNKILNLLVGHTLYNDSTVVLRELIQNSIDAIRLYNYEGATAKIEEKIIISWDSKSRDLKILDEGVGMSQEIIENFLLKVGSSRYQDEEFKKKYPDFFSISRFGIGILTCFLVSDEIDITTLSIDEGIGRRINIRNLDGKYLIQEIPRNEIPFSKNHGTEIRLKIRHNVDMSKLSSDINNWIVFPVCQTLLKIDDGNFEEIGFKSPIDALRNMLRIIGVDPDSSAIKIGSVENGGIHLAYVLSYDSYLREWRFFDTPDYYEDFIKCGTCIEGIRVEFTTPGYNGNNILAFANIKARNAPRTNVSRSNFEDDDEYSKYLSTVYSIYASVITRQINQMHTSDTYSLTSAVSEGKYLINPFFRSYRRNKNVSPVNEELLVKSFFSIPCMLVEKNYKREAFNINDCNNLESFWIIDNALFRTAEFFLQAIEENSSIMKLMGYLEKKLDTKFDNILCGFDHFFVLHQEALKPKGVSEIIINDIQKEISLKWATKSLDSWHRLDNIEVREEYGSRSKLNTLFIQKDDIENNSANKSLVKTGTFIFVFKNSLLHKKITEFIEKYSSKKLLETVITQLLLITLKYSARKFRKEYLSKQIQKEFITDWTSNDIQKIFESVISIETMFDIINDLEDKIYDPTLYKRRRNLSDDIADDLPF